MPTKKASTSKRGRVKVDKLQEPVKELTTEEQKDVKGGVGQGAGKKIRVTIAVQTQSAIKKEP